MYPIQDFPKRIIFYLTGKGAHPVRGITFLLYFSWFTSDHKPGWGKPGKLLPEIFSFSYC